MPQISPMHWLILMLYFIVCYLMIFSKIYFLK